MCLIAAYFLLLRNVFIFNYISQKYIAVIPAKFLLLIPKIWFIVFLLLGNDLAKLKVHFY
ncbi:MAG: hypothetical protein DWQ03_19915 [Calditrichaeota bacterium]|nr:MAG: hypothetical protein DWQ03_19915 [Calditrichota bacterium]